MLKRHLLSALWLALASSSPLLARERVVLPEGAHPTHYQLNLEPDMAHATFKGQVKIDLQIGRPSQTLTLNTAELKFDRVALADGSKPQSVTFNAKNETATLTFAKPLAAGPCRLDIAYRGVIHQHATGLFYLDYVNQGKRQRALFTQLENSDARRLLPCWDEPNQKATFTLTARVPANLMAISNMPLAKSDKQWVRFATTPKMSSYLLFFGLGDFERVSRTVEGVDIGIVVKRGDKSRAAYALDASAQLLTYYNEYFGYKYPLPKMDLIAGPGTSQFFSAMENWGALFYFERTLLFDPKLSTQSEKHTVFMVIAHEMAHQWFGDLVTMNWWDDLWLNEGFASWLEGKATNHFHPEWKEPLSDVENRQGAMQLDARRGTHPVIQPIEDVLQASQAFDSITYTKGKAVIAMLETYVGEDAFRQGVRSYIRKHAYANAVSDDLWKELDLVSPRKVTQMAHDFTLQAGVPLLRVKRSGTGLALTQERFSLDASSRQPQHWLLPVQVGGSVLTLEGTVQIAAPAGVPLANQGQAGYFRTLYEGDLFPEISRGYHRLATIDQLGILEDVWALAMSSLVPVDNVMELLNSLPVDGDPVLLGATVARLVTLDDLEEGLPGRPALHIWGLRLLQPLGQRLGWDPIPGEDDTTTSLRSRVLYCLSLFDDPATLAEARARFAAYLSHPGEINPTVRRTMLAIVASHADLSTWNQIHELAKQAKTPLEKTQLYDLLGIARDRALAARALEIGFSSEVEPSSGPQLLGEVAGLHPALAFDYALAHETELNTRLEPDSRYRFLPRLISSSYDPALLKRLQEYARTHIPATAQIAVSQAESGFAVRMKMRAERVPQIDAWIKSRKDSL